MKIDRHMGIILHLINHKQRTAKQLADHFDVSTRTIKRDMEDLSAAGVPVYAEIGQNGGYQLMDHFKLKENFLNHSEAEIMMAFLNGLKETTPSEEILALHDKFSALGQEASNQDRIKIIMTPSPNRSNMQDKFELLSKARDLLRKVEISYINQELQPSKRIVHPYTLIMIGSQWYLYAYCERRADFRIFKLSRITELQLMNASFIPRELPTVKPWDTMMDSNRECTEVKLLLDPCLLGKLPDYIDLSKCTHTEEGVLAEMNFPVDEWFYSFLMGMIPHIQVLEPAWVKKEFVRRIKKTLETHQG